MTKSGRKFDYSLNYARLDLRKEPEIYRVGLGEQGVLLVQPYKSEILPHWKFKTPADAEKSSRAILQIFRRYRRAKDFVGMDMARKFLQMGYTRSRRYANHPGGRKYDADRNVLPYVMDETKARSAIIFKKAWSVVEGDATYARMKKEWKKRLG